MIPFEILYGNKSTTTVSWDSPIDRDILGLELLHGIDQIVWKVQKELKVAQDIQNIYAELKRQHKEFLVGDHVYLRFKHKKSSLKLESYTKLAPRFCGPFQV